MPSPRENVSPFIARKPVELDGCRQEEQVFTASHAAKGGMGVFVLKAERWERREISVVRWKSVEARPSSVKLSIQFGV